MEIYVVRSLPVTEIDDIYSFAHFPLYLVHNYRMTWLKLMCFFVGMILKKIRPEI